MQEILDWINELLSFRNKDMILKNENFIINCSQESIVTLIVKYRDSPNRSERIKTKLLQNRTTDFTIAMNNNTQLA